MTMVGTGYDAVYRLAVDFGVRVGREDGAVVDGDVDVHARLTRATLDERKDRQ